MKAVKSEKHRVGDGLRCHNYRLEGILRELLAVGAAVLAQLVLIGTVKSKALNYPKVVVLNVLERQHASYKLTVKSSSLAFFSTSF